MGAANKIASNIYINLRMNAPQVQSTGELGHLLD